MFKQHCYFSMNAYQKRKQQEVKVDRLKERREKLCELLQAERDQLEVSFINLVAC